MRLRNWLLAGAIALALAGSASAAYFDFEQITIDNTSAGKGFTSTKITPAGQPVMTIAVCQVETAQIRYAWTDPSKTTVTSSVGTLANPGDTILITGREELVNFRAIRTGSTSGQLNCHYKAVG
jgi:hypothetical protein